MKLFKTSSSCVFCTNKDLKLRGTVAPDKIGLKVVWLDRP